MQKFWQHLFLIKPDFASGQFSCLPNICNFLLICFILAPLAVFILHGQAFHWGVILEYRAVFFHGWVMTLALAGAAFFLSAFLGMLFALAKRSSLRFLRMLASLYIELIRGTPLLVQLLFFFYVVANAFHLENRYIIGCAILSIFASAYIAEILRSGIESISQSQLQAARSLGFTKRQIYRWVIFPQAFRQVLPPLTGQFASLIKDSSLLSILGISEFTYSAQQVNSATYSTLESFFPLGIGYLILTLPISLWSKRLEKSYRYET